MSAYWLVLGAFVQWRWGWRSLWVVATTTMALDVAARIGGTEVAYRLGGQTRAIIGRTFQ